MTLKTNIFLQFSHSHPRSVTTEVLRIMYSRETKKVDTPQRIVQAFQLFTPMSDFGEWLSEVIITLKTNIFFTAFPLAPKLCNYKSAKNHVFTRNKKIRYPSENSDKKRNRQKLFNTGHHKHLSFSISRKNPWVWGCWCDTNENRKITLGEIPYGLAVRIPGFHPGGPGSTPGMGKNAFFYFASIIPAFQLFIPMSGNDFQRW